MYIALLIGIILIASIAIVMLVHKKEATPQSDQVSAGDFEIIEKL